MKEMKICGGTVKGGKRHEYTQRKLDLVSAFVNQFYDEICFAGKRKQETGRRRVSEKYAGFRLVDEVESICWHSVSEVYDISVPETHKFSANGLAAHNCDDFEALTGIHDTVFDPETITDVEDYVYDVRTEAKTRKRPMQAYAIQGDSIDLPFILSNDDPRIDWEKPVIKVTWRSHRGKSYEWEMIPLLPLDEEIEKDTFDLLLVYEEPQPGCDYSCGVDTADGLDKEEEERACASIDRVQFGADFDVQVAELTSRRMNPAQMVGFVACMAAYFGVSTKDWRGVKFAIEQVRGPGDTCQNQLKLMGFNYHHAPRRYDSKKVKDASRSKEGWYSNTWSVPILMTRFVQAVNDGWYKPQSKGLIEELKTLERHITSGKSKMEHRAGQFDDRVRAAAQSYFTVHDLDDLAERSKKRNTQPVKKKTDPNAGRGNTNSFSVGGWE